MDTLKFLVSALKNKYNKVVLIRVDDDGALARSSELLSTCN